MKDALKEAAKAALDFVKKIRGLVEGDIVLGKVTLLVGKFLAFAMAINVVGHVLGFVKSILFGTMNQWMWLAAGVAAVTLQFVDMKDAIEFVQQPWVLWVAGLTAAVFVLPKLISLVKGLVVSIYALGWAISVAEWGTFFGALAAGAKNLALAVGAGAVALGLSGFLALVAAVAGVATVVYAAKKLVDSDVNQTSMGWRLVRRAQEFLGPKEGEPEPERRRFTEKEWEWVQNPLNKLWQMIFPQAAGAAAGGAGKMAPGYAGLAEYSKQFQTSVLGKDPLVDLGKRQLTELEGMHDLAKAKPAIEGSVFDSTGMV